MTAIAITKFSGAAKGITPRLIPVGFAQDSENTDISEGSLKPASGSTVTGEVLGMSSVASMYKYPNGKWLTWTSDVDVVRSPLVDDQWSRIYWTGQSAPKMAAVNNATAGTAPHPNAWYSLGVPAPVSAPAAAGAVAGEGEEEPATAISAAYAVAYVTEYEEVGPLSLPSDVVTRWDDGGDVVITLPPIDAPGRNIVKLRVFRSETGGNYLFVDDVVAGTASFTDSVDSEDLGIAANSISFDPPPEDLAGLMAGPGGALYGFRKNVLCASEPGYPHAWPTDYRLAFQDDIVGIAESAVGIVVATSGAPWIVTGATPAALNPIKIETREPCVSKRSVVDMGDYVLYASPNGLVSVGGQGASLITKTLISRDEWKKLNPSSIHAYRDRDRYLAFFTDGDGIDRCFAFSHDRGFEFVDASAHTAHYVGESDTLYIFDGDTALKKWGEGSAKTLRWRSGIYEAQPGTGFTCGKVIADQYPVQLTLYADGAQAVNQTVQSAAMFRLPAGIHAREWEVELSSSYEIFSVQIAQSPQELT